MTPLSISRKLISLATRLAGLDYAVESARQPEYVGIFFSAAEWERLLASVPAVHPLGPADPHITVLHATERKGTWNDPVVAEAVRHLVGHEVRVQVTGVAQDDKIQVVTVKIPDDAMVLNPMKIMHITISWAAGVGPRYSKDLLAKPGTVTPFNGPELTGRFDVYPSGSLV